MKSIKFFALLLAAGFPCVAFAEFLGAPIPAALNAENAIGLFVGALAVMSLLADYPARARRSLVAALAPASAKGLKAESHRLAA